jgi:ferredoxin-fold anticodon binding domain-containing protein
MIFLFHHPEKHYVFKILDFDNKPIETYYLQDATEKKITIQHVRSGSYHLQAVEDINDNGEWDSGDFIKKLQPEKIINFQETYEVKGNWELEIEVKL